MPGCLTVRGATSLFLFAVLGCAGRSKLEVSGSGGSAGTGGFAANGGSAGAPVACEADLLRDAAHCGRCFHDCEGGECAGGECQPVALLRNLPAAPTALALDEEYVWFTPPLSRSTKRPGTLERFVQPDGDVWGIAADAEFVFWVNVSNGLVRFDRATETVEALGVTGYRVALDDDYAYTARDGVWRVGRASGEPELLASLLGEAIAVDEEYVYFTVPSSGGFYRLSKAGGEPEALTARSSASYIAAYDGRVYISEQQAPAGVFEVTGPGLRTLVASLEEPFGVAADSFGVFWADWADGSIWMRSHEPGAAPKKLASGQRFPRDLAIDARAVYWTNDDAVNGLMKVAKP
jgi:hypothetical protein